MALHNDGRFVAFASRLQALAVVACFLPIVAAGLFNLVFLPNAPVALRAAGVIIVSPMIIWFGIAGRLILMKEPVIEIDQRGLLWRRWSEVRIPWTAISGWRERRTMGMPYVTFRLHEPERYPATTINGVIARFNQWLGYDHITLSAAGTNRTAEELTAAVRAHGPPPTEGRPHRSR